MERERKIESWRHKDRKGERHRKRERERRRENERLEREGGRGGREGGREARDGGREGGRVEARKRGKKGNERPKTAESQPTPITVCIPRGQGPMHGDYGFSRALPFPTAGR